MTIRILALSGGLRRASTNTALVRAARELAPESIEIELYDGIASLPHFDADLEAEPPAAVVDLRERIAAADGLLIATPEYGYSIPGALKNALDWASRPNGQSVLTHKPVALMGASPSAFGTVRAQNHLRDVLHAVDATVAAKPEVHVNGSAERFGTDGTLIDDTARKLIAELLDTLIILIEGH